MSKPRSEMDRNVVHALDTYSAVHTASPRNRTKKKAMAKAHAGERPSEGWDGVYGGSGDGSEAFVAFLADAANAGLYQATHLSLQESECAEAFRAAALLPPGRRPRRAEGLFKWLGSAADAGALLNDGWYLGTLRLVRAPAAAEAQAALGRALFPFAPYREGGTEIKEDDGALRIGAGLADNSLTATGAEALASLVRTFGRVVEGLHLERKFADGPAGVAALGEALRAGSFPQLRTLDISNNSGATKADLGELSAACPQLEVRD